MEINCIYLEKETVISYLEVDPGYKDAREFPVNLKHATVVAFCAISAPMGTSLLPVYDDVKNLNTTITIINVVISVNLITLVPL